MQTRFAAAIAALCTSILVLAACGGPSSPSEEGVVLRGTVVGDGTFSAST